MQISSFSRLESEDQLDDAKRPGEEKDKKDDKDCKEEKGVDMSEDFEGKMQDLDKKEADDSSDEDPEDEDDVDKQMGETEDGAEK
jgi:midasin